MTRMNPALWAISFAGLWALSACSDGDSSSSASNSSSAEKQCIANFDCGDYTLEGVVVLSRHNIRAPLSDSKSTIGQLTPHEWYAWPVKPKSLSPHGELLEEKMGAYFREWISQNGLKAALENQGDAVRIYANSMQRTIATATHFAAGMFPKANVEIEHHCEVDVMDSIFTPQFTFLNDDYKKRALKQVEDMFGDGSLAGIGRKLTENYALLGSVLDMEESVSCKEKQFCEFDTDDTEFIMEVGREPSVKGSLTTATGAADALVLQYYENAEENADFGHNLTVAEWEKVSAVKDFYGDVLFTAPLVAVNVARPLLKEILSELNAKGRQFSFLCGHDSNVGSVLAALGVSDYTLPKTIESKTPIGVKLVIEKWRGKDGVEYANMSLVYQTTEQLRNMTTLSLETPPESYKLTFDGLSANKDGLYKMTDVESLFEKVIAKYDEL